MHPVVRHFRPVIFIITFFILVFFSKSSFVKSFFLSFILYLCLGGWKFTRLVILTLPRDFHALFALLRVKYYLRWMNYRGHQIIDIWKETVQKYEDKLMLIDENTSWTFKQTDEFSNRIANILSSHGFKKGDVVALFMESRPAYVGIWLGMAKIGVVPALINFNLRTKSLLHSIKDAKCVGLIYGVEVTSAVETIFSQLDQENEVSSLNFKIFQANFGLNSNDNVDKPLDKCFNLDELVGNPIESATSSCLPPTYYTNPNSRGKVSIKNPLLYIYTSGTTGLPKAAIINQGRFYTMAHLVTLLFHIEPSDRIYNSLPLYHTAGGMIGIGQSLLTGSTVVIRRKFSASRYWADVKQYNCTIVQYIGEICRYLLAQPSRPEDQEHNVRLAFGNGVRPQIWEEFQKRFNIKQIGEFYGATESNANLANTQNKVGAVGFTTRIVPSMHPVALIKIDQDTSEPIRNSEGFCQRCKVDEPGELIGRIDKKNPSQHFDGYVNKQATNKKILQNVFKTDDEYFRTGDLLVMDELGYFYFRDRLGDTYRWRGENVSTAEVEGVIGQCLEGQHDCVVYGVEVAQCEGRAGMACIVDANHQIDLSRLAKEVTVNLPPYARPVFLRLAESIEKTGTFKLKKMDLIKDGFDPSKSSDRLFYWDAGKSIYQPLTANVYNDILEGKLRL